MANEFTRDNLLFSLCGLNCSLCPLFIRKECTGVLKAACVTKYVLWHHAAWNMAAWTIVLNVKNTPAIK